MKLRNLFTDTEIIDALPQGDENYSDMAAALSSTGKADVTRQLARYWARQFETTKKNGDFYLTLAIANRELKAKRELRVPKANDQLALIYQPNDPARILCFGDTHAPYHHPDAVSFLAEVSARTEPTMVVHTGDEVDHHALSFHNSDPDLDSAGVELERARQFVLELESVFPALQLVESNHGSLAYRKAKAHGVPAAYIKTYREVLFPDGGGKAWSWHHRIRIENEYGRDIQFQHEGKGDLMTLAAHEMANMIVGHEHAKYGIGYAASQVDTYWSMYTGWLGDIDSLAFAYGQAFPKKPVVGCGFINEGQPQLIAMPLDKHGRWTGKVVV